jgi:hypothetical protein
MKKIILLGVVISACIILMASAASAVEYRAVIEQNTKEIISQETTNDIKTVSEKLTDLIPAMNITHRDTRLITILILLLIMTALFSKNKFIRLIFSMMRTIVRISGLILIQILKIIRFPFKLISKPITLLIRLIRLIILLPNIRIGIYHPLITDIMGRFS